MKIYSDSFRKWFRIMEILSDAKDPFRECAYFNFLDSYIYFNSVDGIGRFKFNFEKDADENIPNFFVPISKLISIINQYDEVTLNDSFVFSNGKDKYKVATLIDDDQIDISIFENSYDNELEFSKEQLEKISKALSFVNKDDATAFQAVFIEDAHIVGMVKKTPVYEAKFDCSENAVIPYFTAKMLLQIGNGESCTFCTNRDDTNSQKIISDDKELEVIVSCNSEIEFPNIHSDSVVQSYTHNTPLKVDSSIFAKALDSLKPYYNDVLNAKIKLVLGDDIAIKVEDKTTDIERHIDYVEINDELKEKSYSISALKVLQALSAMKGKEFIIDLPTDDNKPIVNFYVDDSEHVLITRFKED